MFEFFTKLYKTDDIAKGFLYLSLVRIYEYSPGFLHSKQMLVDGEAATVGTINFDYRSLLHHYE
ncbi:MAG: phospholipase D-like domain-containing protein, partial [Hoylesella saccharolytica]